MYCKAIFLFNNWHHFASDNPFCFRKNLLEGIKKLIMAIDDKTWGEKLQYSIIREAQKISA